MGQDLRSLFAGMVKLLPEDRLSLEDVKRSEWLKKEVYSESELVELMKKEYEL